MTGTHPTAAPAEGSQTTPGDTLTGELALLVIAHSEPDVCDCGATWDLDRALTVAARAGIRPAHSSE